MINRIAHFADLHLREPSREKEYEYVFEQVFIKLEENPVDLIVISGDIFHTKNNVKNETKLLAKKILDELTQHARVIVINGNHDGNPRNATQKNSLETLVELIGNENITYYGKSGIYEFDNINFAVWDYFDGLNPYVVDTLMPSNNILIDLYHNPVKDTQLFNGMVLDNHSFNVNNFRGELFLLGDIHKRQIFKRKNSIGGYPSSLIQQDHGESMHEHGFLIWDLTTKTFTEIDIDSEYAYLTIPVYDVNNLAKDFQILDDIISDSNLAHLRLRIVWTDYAAQINTDNERKIRKFIKDNYDNLILELKFKKVILGATKITESSFDDEVQQGFDLLNPQTLQEIFQRYLLANKYTNEDIAKVIDLDTQVSQTFTYESFSANWKLLSLTLDNYRSHGNEFEIDLREKNGIFQVKGRNEQGKTNLLSAICYLLYGKTLETLKKEKNGDNRFINNKRDLDYCQVSGIFDINGEYFKILRRSDRKWSKNKKDISGVSTTIEFRQVDENLNELENLNDEQKKKTEQVVLQAIGSFEDFLRSSFITADSLNGLLSADESTFIDSLLRDSGLDLFEKKLAAFKEYKKENPILKPRIDVNDSEVQIELLEMEINNDQDRIKSIEDEALKIEEDIKTRKALNEVLNGQFKPVPSVEIFHERDARNEIGQLNTQQLTYSSNIDQLETDLLKYPTEFTDEDEAASEQCKINAVEFTNWTNSIKEELGAKKNLLGEKLQLINLQKSEVANREKILNLNETEIANIKLRYSSIKIEKERKIRDLEKSTSCVTCERDFDESTQEAVQKSINYLHADMEDDEEKRFAEVEMVNIRSKEITAEIKEYNNWILENQTLADKIQKDMKFIEESFLVRHQENNLTLTKCQDLEMKRKRVESRKTLEAQLENNQLKLDQVMNKIKELEDKIISSKALQAEVESVNLHNTKIKGEISTHDFWIDDLQKKFTQTQVDIKGIEGGSIPMKKQSIYNLEKAIQLFKAEEQKEKIQNLYLNCIHRDGIPRMLLGEMKDIINVQLSNLLSGLSFNVFFDENMTLKMYDHVKPDALINVIGGSGKQRTFISLSLRMALREINNRCINNLLFVDEIMGKLVENSVEEFIELLNEAKNKIDKIFIVEHAYSDVLNPDYVFEIEKDEKGVSNIKIVL